MSVNATLLAELERLLPSEAPGIAVREAHAGVGLWSLVHIKHALRQLERCGRARSTLERRTPAIRVRLYCRQQSAGGLG